MTCYAIGVRAMPEETLAIWGYGPKSGIADGCQADRKAERNTRREDTERINTCQTGPFPAFVEDADEEDKAELTPEQFPDPEADFPDEPLEEGDQIWATGLFPQAEHIRATATVSQRLAEGF